jgi:hypothetical protein
MYVTVRQSPEKTQIMNHLIQFVAAVLNSFDATKLWEED